MTEVKDPELSPLEAAEKRRADRKAAVAAARDAQLAIDTDAISEKEAVLLDSLTKAINIPHIPGMVAKVLIRCPNKPEIKRYRDMVKPDKNGNPRDATDAHELLGTSLIEYPDAEAFELLCERLPSLRGQCGIEGVALSAGEAEKAGKR